MSCQQFQLHLWDTGFPELKEMNYRVVASSCLHRCNTTSSPDWNLSGGQFGLTPAKTSVGSEEGKSLRHTQPTKMADPRKTTNSSMIDLKAELFRKQEEYKQLKAQNTSDYVKGVKTNKQCKGDKIWSKKNAGVLQRAGRDLAEKEEEDNVMERSRRALEAKSKIYDQIASASGIPDEDGSEGFLVDFQRKAVDRISEQRREEGRTGVSKEVDDSAGHGDLDDGDDDLSNNEPVPFPASPEEEWVDYVDTFGRSRRCMRKDLPHLEKQERPLGRPPGDGGLKLKEGATLMSADMKRELRRQQWEKEAEESVNGPVHYANVQYDEIRSHGTGFYQFSKDSNLRDEQMEMLNKLREQTVDSRQRSERIKEKRKAALEARLAKVKHRRKMKDGSLGVDDKEEEEQKAAEDPAPQAAVQEAEPLTRDDSWRRSAPVREWDIGKEKLPEWTAKHYMDQKRSERESEFAPPQFYFDQKKTAPSGAKPREQSDSLRNIVPQSVAGRGQLTTPSSSLPSNTEAVLKQIRQSFGASPDTQGSVDKDTKHADSDAGVSVASIPLPQMDTVAGSAHGSVEEEQRQVAGVTFRDHETGEMVRQQSAVPGGGYAQPLSSNPAGPPQQEMYGAPLPDMSLPPPGFPVALPHVLGQQTDTIPPPQSFPASSSIPSAQGAGSGTQFMYPSQQGLLHALPTTPVVTPPAPKPAAVPKVSMVDKRFMQNREVSEEDLLGYMVQTSADPLTNIQPVSYTPGIFSSGASSLSSPATSVPEEAPTAATSEGETTKQAAETTKPAAQTTKPAAQTEGVIFGVPDFLQPATVTATSYQPGSFMAAKEAAAQRAEEQYEEARKKTQYSSAPVLYARPDDGDLWEGGGTGCSGKATEKEKVSAAQQDDEGDEEFAKFMREVRGNK
ncbi:uncharacterized protein LOC143297779 [Babylonia areolata]|uniref:uncharacterized protein LOC143297779 n=1 Tax=Babylonia areolata TaxID=304850 RepID=UPI003FCF591C